MGMRFEDVKDKLKKLVCIPRHGQKLLLDDNILDDKKTIQDCGLNSGDTINLILTKFDGGRQTMIKPSELKRR